MMRIIIIIIFIINFSSRCQEVGKVKWDENTLAQAFRLVVAGKPTLFVGCGHMLNVRVMTHLKTTCVGFADQH